MTLRKYGDNMTPTLTLARPTTAALCGRRQMRTVGNDGLTDVEREKLALLYRTEGPGRSPDAQELQDAAAWILAKRGPARLA